MTRITVPTGHESNPYAFAAGTHAKPIMAAAAQFAAAVYCETALSLREFEGARMRTAQLNGCIICQGFRAARDAADAFSVDGTAPRQIVSNNGPAPEEAFYAAVEHWRDPAAGDFSERERLAIEFAERFAVEPKVLSADEDFWARMHAAFSDGEIVDLAHCVAAWVGLGRVAHVLGFDSVCAVPEPA